MKNAILILALFTACFRAEAQITITSADMPSNGDTVRRSITYNFTNLVPDSTGAGHTWDYSMLVADSQTVDTFTSLLSTGLYALNFIGASFAQKSNTPPLNLGVATVEYKYDFFGKTSSSYTNWGIGADVSGLPLGMVNNPRDTLYRFPLNYLDTGNATTFFSASVPGLGSISGMRNRVDTVDGWGTLITPYGTFDVLRVKSVVNEIDTLEVTSIGLVFPFTLPERIEYKWLGLGMDIPLLQIGTSLGNVIDVTYRDSLRIILTGLQHLQADKIKVYPSPAEDVLTIEGLKKGATITIVDALGKTVSVLRYEQGKSIAVSQLKPGIYLLRMEENGSTLVKRFVKQ